MNNEWSGGTKNYSVEDLARMSEEMLREYKVGDPVEFVEWVGMNNEWEDLDAMGIYGIPPMPEPEKVSSDEQIKTYHGIAGDLENIANTDSAPCGEHKEWCQRTAKEARELADEIESVQKSRAG